MAFAWTKDTGGTLNTGFVAAYNLENSSGTDDKGGVTITENGAPAHNPGKNGNAVDFGSANTTKWLSTSNDLGFSASSAQSYSFWVNITTAPSSGVSQGLFTRTPTADKVQFVIFYQNSGGTLQLLFTRIRAGTAIDGFTTNFTLTTGTWFNLIMTYDGTTIEGWVNGVSKGTVAASGSGASQPAVGFAIGSDDVTKSDIPSCLEDAFYVWSKKLSGTEIADLYNAGTGSFYVSAAPSSSAFLAFM